MPGSVLVTIFLFVIITINKPLYFSDAACSPNSISMLKNFLLTPSF